MAAEKRIPLHELHEITNGFSVDSRIGQGGYGDVYKGVYNGREVAVKLLHVDTVQGIDDQQYINEVDNLSRAKHPNIIQLLGYSYETTSELVEHNSKRRLSQHIYRALCFEYLQGGSLDVRLREKSLAPDWSTRYNIIKGICEGLNFLHGCKPAIFHLDLKPANILLDNAMVPKVADFGLSRVISQSHTQVTKQIRGSQAYMPPEFVNGGNISHRNDVFSLGLVMIEIMTGSLGYSNSIEMDKVVQFKQKVHTDWKNRIKARSEYPLEELHQVQTCIDTAMRCLEPDRNNRPTIAEVLDMLNKTETHIPKRQLADVLPCPIIGPNNTMANTLKEMAAELDNITNQNRHSSYMPENSSNVQQVTDIRETISDVEKELIIGRTEEIQEIVATLCGSTTPENKITVLPIYGMGGIGKTTLAQLVFNDSKFASYSQVWIYVSQNLDLNKVGNLIISQLSEESHVTNKQMIYKKLRELFAGKKILIVLDDVWETNPRTLKDLKAMLRPGVGSMVTVIVTTRDEAIAREICHTVGPYKLETLTNKSCWKIIKQQTAFKDRVDKKQLKHIGKEIATKCGGVALAAQSLGYTLKGKTSDEWESVRDNYIWNLTISEDPSSTHHEVLASLLLSYIHMPNWLKLCFSYCAVFPKGHNIAKYDLIHQWIALGFTEQSNTFDSMQLCEKYVRQLLGMSFLQYAKTQPFSGRKQDKDAILFTMHDLVHDLAKDILSHQLNTGGNKCRYALLRDCSKSLQLFVNFPANVKALRFEDCGGRELCGGAFSSARCLRVLDLSECLIEKLPDCIGQLKQLRFLHAPCIRNFEIPNCITELSELNYLNLRGSYQISALPESIGDMKGLMHLDLSGCYEIRELPVSFSELKQLVHLDLSGCTMFLAEALGGCTKLQYLNLAIEDTFDHKRITGLPEVIGNLIKLRYLNLSGCVDLMGPTPLMGEYPDWVEEIHRLLCSISTFSNLEHLVLSCNDQISSIPESFGNLTKLHTLDLTRCYFVHKLPDNIFKMVSLKVLIESYMSLGESTLPRFNFVSLPHFEVSVSSDKCHSNISLLQPTNTRELEIYKLENVKSAKEAMSVKLIEKQEIISLTFQWTLGAERFVDDKVVLEKLVPPSSVLFMKIIGYRSHSVPDWFMDIRHYLPNLISIELYGFSNCNNLLPPLGELPELQYLNLDRMEGLAEWSTRHYSGKEGSNEIMFPKLEMLTIKQCTKLRIKQCLPGARCLWIEGCDNMLSSWGESSTHISGSSSSHITELDVYGSKVPLRQWRLLYHLPALHTLRIWDCSDLSSSSDMIQHLSSIDLKCLQLISRGQAELPNWLTKLTSLQELVLIRCERMTSLPQWLGELTSLKKIEIKYSPKLKKWFQSKEAERFIALIDVTVEGFPGDSDEEDISNESAVLEEDSEESNEETDEETTNSQDSESGSNQRKRPRYDGVSNPSSLPPTWMAPTIPRSRASDIITQEMSCHPPPSPVARDMMPSMPTAIAINAPALSVVVISDDDADDMNLSIICTSDDDRPTVKAPARPARLTPCRPARPTPCSPLGLLIASSPATPLFGDGAEVDIVPGTSGTHIDVLPRPGDILVDAMYDADDEGPLLAASSGSWASLQRARKGKAKQNDTDIDYLDDVPIISNKMRSLLELRELDAEAGSTGAAASASSPAVLSLGLNAAASASVTPRCYQRSPAREEEDDAACGERPPEQTEDPQKRNSSGTEEEGDRFSFRFLFDAFLAVVACFCSPQTQTRH